MLFDDDEDNEGQAETFQNPLSHSHHQKRTTSLQMLGCYNPKTLEQNLLSKEPIDETNSLNCEQFQQRGADHLDYMVPQIDEEYRKRSSPKTQVDIENEMNRHRKLDEGSSDCHKSTTILANRRDVDMTSNATFFSRVLEDIQVYRAGTFLQT